MNLLEIQDPSFLKKLSKKELMNLSKEIRSFLIENISNQGGHLSSNLGVVELTIAMHYVFNSPEDKILFDVGHQSYTHKILTGRAKDFATLRQFDGLTGFINKNESIHDIWESGHSSTSISAQCGFLLADSDKNHRVITLIGDSSIANGVSFEALNYMGSNRNLTPIIILNDNKMSISRSVGAISRSFSKLRSTKAYQKINSGLVRITPRCIRTFFHRLKRSIKGLILKENIFEEWGFDYMGPYDGNDLAVCIKTLSAAKNLNKPCVIHFVTKKGKGYQPAEEDKSGNYHSVGPFDKLTGIQKCNTNPDKSSYSLIAASYLEKLIENKDFMVITPAMIKGSELDSLQAKYPKNVIDVGMAEEHATVMASALGQQNKNVVLMLYSTFSQRSYDYLLNDIARSNVHVIIALDRADFVSGDGCTHQGIYDICMLNSMPNFEILSPRNGSELCALFDYASNSTHPVAIRYPKAITTNKIDNSLKIEKVSWEKVRSGKAVTILTYGENIEYILNIEMISDTEVINARFIRPLDEVMLDEICKSGNAILIYENAVGIGGFTSSIYRYLIEHNYHNKIKSLCLSEDSVVPTGDVESLRKYFHLAKEDIINAVKELKGEDL